MSIEGEVRVLINKLVFEGTMDTWEEDLNHTLSAILKLTNLKPLDNREMLVYLIPWEPFIHQCKNTSPIELTEKLADGICSHFSKSLLPNKFLKMDFEDYLTGVHADQYVGTKDCMIDDFNKWVQDLGVDELIEYGNRYHRDLINIYDNSLKRLNGEGGV